jgi:FKBP-type peptidyl-prolyl cis-trans isomerase (trigger factor)
MKNAFRAQLLVRRIADKEKIFCTEEDIASRITSLAYAYGHTPEELFDLYEKRGWMNTLREEIRAEKVRNFLREKAEIVDKEVIEKEKADEEKEPVTEKESVEKEEPPAEPEGEGLGLGA